MFCFVFVFVFHSFSLHSNPYHVGYDVNPTTGEIYQTEHKEISTFASRLANLWFHISSSRDDFESAPDTGILGKRFSRLINYFWNYLIKGLIGSILIITVFPLLCILNIFLSIILSLTSPAWVVVFAFLSYLFDLIVYDFHRPDSDWSYFSWRYQWKIFPALFSLFYKTVVLGCGSLVASLVKVVGCILFSFLYFIYGCVAWVSRSFWDAFFLNLVLRPLGRIPATDSFLAKLVSGPGSAQSYFQRVSPNHVMLLLQLALEEQELQLIHNYHLAKINEPEQAALEVYASMFSFFSNSAYSIPAVIPRSSVQQRNRLDSIMRERRNRATQFQIGDRYRIRLTEADLNECYTLGVVLTEKFVTERIIGTYKPKEEYFKERK